uniref:ABC transporter ATP-binding protein n=1 Tax=Schaalia sp. TaxID=2691890 RepID=UPI003D1028F8
MIALRAPSAPLPSGGRSAPAAPEDRAPDLGGEDRATPRELAARALVAGYGKREVVHGVDLEIATGRITAIIGANASGKSTLLKTAARVLAPIDGAVLLDGERISSLPTRELATRLGLLPQHPLAPEGIAVADLVARGRHPHEGLFGRRSGADERIVEEALLATRTADLADRAVDELSGGQRQRVAVARALALNPEVIVLDEAVSALDVLVQNQILYLLNDLQAQLGLSYLFITHDLAVVRQIADDVVVMEKG